MSIIQEASGNGTEVRGELAKMKVEARALHDRLDKFDDWVETYGETWSRSDSPKLIVLLDEIRELLEYLADHERRGEKVDLKDRNYLVMKWGLEESLRGIDR